MNRRTDWNMAFAHETGESLSSQNAFFEKAMSYSKKVNTTLNNSKATVLVFKSDGPNVHPIVVSFTENSPNAHTF
jgi:hypothetical protein